MSTIQNSEQLPNFSNGIENPSKIDSKGDMPQKSIYKKPLNHGEMYLIYSEENEF
jgi:hypothetical protein